MRFKSPHAGLMPLIRPYKPELVDDAGRIVREEVRRLTCHFGVFGDEYEYTDPLTGATERGADIRGGFYDTDVAAEQNEWTEEEKLLVEQRLTKLCREQPAIISVYEDPRVPAPWPSYDETKPARIPALAAEIDRIEATLAYEAQNLNRPKVMAELKALVKSEAPEPEPEPEPEDENANALVAEVS